MPLATTIPPKASALRRWRRFFWRPVEGMSNKVISPGEKFGQLTAIREGEKRRSGKNFLSTFVCSCSCGTGAREYISYRLRNGRVKSCGCRLETHTKHGMADKRPYRIWCSMKSRCTRPNHKAFSRYGGRGISVCKEWQTFDGFWADMKDGYADDLEIDRIDPNGNYCKDNCRWADRQTQTFNRVKSPTKLCPYPGVTKSASRWSARMYMNGEILVIGSFDNVDEAIAARKNAELAAYGFTSTTATGWPGMEGE